MWYDEKRIVASSHPALGHQLIYYCDSLCGTVESVTRRSIPTLDKAGGLGK